MNRSWSILKNAVLALAGSAVLATPVLAQSAPALALVAIPTNPLVPDRALPRRRAKDQERELPASAVRELREECRASCPFLGNIRHLLAGKK
jgi:hypothetical protein